MPDGSDTPAREPLKSYHRILHQELALAEDELTRPAGAILSSGLLAGLGICLSVFLIAVLYTTARTEFSGFTIRFLIGNAYAAGFLVVIFARADLFTEYTTIALLPVLFRRARVAALARLWGLVYAGNLIGVLVGAFFLVRLGAHYGGFTTTGLGQLGYDLVDASVRGLLLGALFAGWLVGLLSWLIVAARETVSQVVFVWVIGMAIGVGQLPHSITGTAEVAAAAMAGMGIGVGEVLRFVALSTLGNALGSLLFALLIRYAVGSDSLQGSGGRAPATSEDG